MKRVLLLRVLGFGERRRHFFSRGNPDGIHFLDAQKQLEEDGGVLVAVVVAVERRRGRGRRRRVRRCSWCRSRSAKTTFPETTGEL